MQRRGKIFCGDPAETYDGRWDDASHWNGFLNPYLTRADTERFLTALQAGDIGAGFTSTVTWDGDDALYVLMDGEDIMGSESFGPESDGPFAGLYAVGWGYTWEPCEGAENPTITVSKRSPGGFYTVTVDGREVGTVSRYADGTWVGHIDGVRRYYGSVGKAGAVELLIGEA